MVLRASFPLDESNGPNPHKPSRRFTPALAMTFLFLPLINLPPYYNILLIGTPFVFPKMEFQV